MVSVVDIIQRVLFMVSIVGCLFMVSVVAGNVCYGFRRRFYFHGFRRGRKTCFMVSVAGFLVDSAAARGSIISECIERFLVVVVFLGLVSVAVFLLWFPSWQENDFLWFPSLDFWWILPPQEDPTF